MHKLRPRKSRKASMKITMHLMKKKTFWTVEKSWPLKVSGAFELSLSHTHTLFIHYLNPLLLILFCVVLINEFVKIINKICQRKTFARLKGKQWRLDSQYRNCHIFMKIASILPILRISFLFHLNSAVLHETVFLERINLALHIVISAIEISNPWIICSLLYEPQRESYFDRLLLFNPEYVSEVIE